MFNLVTIVGRGYHNYMTRKARQNALRLLARQNDATLRDIGISREMLSGGIASWPWQSVERGALQHSEQHSEQCPAPRSEKHQEQTRSPAIDSKSSRRRATYHKVMSKARSIRELRSFSNRELRDLGITRDSIVEAVNYGRAGIEHSASGQQPAIIVAAAVAPVKKPLAQGRTDGDQLQANDYPLAESTTSDRQAA